MTITYLIIFIVQLFRNDLLSEKIYLYVSTALFVLACLELVKTIAFNYGRIKRLEHRLRNKLDLMNDRTKIEVIVEKMINVLILIEYIVLMVLGMLFPMLEVRQDIDCDKINNCFKVLTFSLFLLNLFFQQRGYNSYDEIRHRIKKLQ